MLLRILDRLEEIIIATLMGAATFLTFITVVHRFLVNVPILYPILFPIRLAWSQELCIYMFIWMAKFGAAYGVRTGIHVGVDVLINRLNDTFWTELETPEYNRRQGNAVKGVTLGDIDAPCKALNGTLYNCYLPSGTIGVLSTSNAAPQLAYGPQTGWDFATGIGTVNATNIQEGAAAFGQGGQGGQCGQSGSAAQTPTNGA